MVVLTVFGFIWGAMIAAGIWESCAEGRYIWGQKTLGWRIPLGKYHFTEYHFFLFIVMLPLLFLLPLALSGWNIRLIGIMISAVSSGYVLEDITWYISNPKVKMKEFFSSFSDHYPWFKIGKRKIIPIGYVLGIVIALLSWYLIWR